MKSKTDEQLMDIIQKNKDDQSKIAFDHLYHRYAKPMVNYFYYALKNDHDKAQDFLHDLFLKISENKERFNCNQSFKPWIYRIAINMCNNDYRREKVFHKYEEHIKSSDRQYDTINHLENTIGHDLWNYVNNLEPEKRALILLRFKFDLSVKEMSLIFNCAEGTIKSRLFYTTKELSKILKKQNYDF
jgi:RNA polymerase sigma-70 factor (ECF subfamily)